MLHNASKKQKTERLQRTAKLAKGAGQQKAYLDSLKSSSGRGWGSCSRASLQAMELSLTGGH